VLNLPLPSTPTPTTGPLACTLLRVRTLSQISSPAAVGRVPRRRGLVSATSLGCGAGDADHHSPLLPRPTLPNPPYLHPTPPQPTPTSPPPPNPPPTISHTLPRGADVARQRRPSVPQSYSGKEMVDIGKCQFKYYYYSRRKFLVNHLVKRGARPVSSLKRQYDLLRVPERRAYIRTTHPKHFFRVIFFVDSRLRFLATAASLASSPALRSRECVTDCRKGKLWSRTLYRRSTAQHY